MKRRTLASVRAPSRPGRTARSSAMEADSFDAAGVVALAVTAAPRWGHHPRGPHRLRSARGVPGVAVPARRRRRRDRRVLRPAAVGARPAVDHRCRHRAVSGHRPAVRAGSVLSCAGGTTTASAHLGCSSRATSRRSPGWGARCATWCAGGAHGAHARAARHPAARGATLTVFALALTSAGAAGRRPPPRPAGRSPWWACAST